MPRFILTEPAPFDKSFPIIDTEGDLTLDVDYDDVNHAEVLPLAREVVNVLNHHFALKERYPTQEG